MSQDNPFDGKISIKLNKDEAIVLAWYLTRELWNEDEKNLRASFVHPAEPHSLEAVLQELMNTSDRLDQVEGIERAARESVLRRYT